MADVSSAVPISPCTNESDLKINLRLFSLESGVAGRQSQIFRKINVKAPGAHWNYILQLLQSINLHITDSPSKNPRASVAFFSPVAQEALKWSRDCFHSNQIWNFMSNVETKHDSLIYAMYIKNVFFIEFNVFMLVPAWEPGINPLELRWCTHVASKL